MDIGPLVGPKNELIAWLQQKRLLARSQNCSSCSTAMREGHRSNTTDGVVWRCPQCKGTKEWELLQQVLSSFAKVAPSNSVLVEGISSEGRCRWCWYPQDNTAGDMHRWLREVCAAQSCCRCPLCLVVGELYRSMNPFSDTKLMLVCINDGIMIVFWVLVLLCSIIMVVHQDQRSGFFGV